MGPFFVSIRVYVIVGSGAWHYFCWWKGVCRKKLGNHRVNGSLCWTLQQAVGSISLELGVFCSRDASKTCRIVAQEDRVEELCSTLVFVNRCDNTTTRSPTGRTKMPFWLMFGSDACRDQPDGRLIKRLITVQISQYLVFACFYACFGCSNDLRGLLQ